MINKRILLQHICSCKRIILNRVKVHKKDSESDKMHSTGKISGSMEIMKFCMITQRLKVLLD